ncbi:SAM-dependent methyltransferase [Plantactinospora siamensis]|uniref:S-adenosyl-L-methionine-dependent methyltransferase n=1 Tax=Plantactinospora siamensis TaxID=555372 RepID=A0ABV6NXN0_9ACTN
MELGQPSRTAFSAASHLAEHQVVDGGRIFHDPLAVPILGVPPDELRERWQGAGRGRRLMALFIAVRSRFAEDALAAAVDAGTRQLVVLGAGLDTFAYRNPHAGAGLRVLEVDHPATQAWKRDRLADAGIAVPPTLTFVPVDFERDVLADRVRYAGRPASDPVPGDPARPGDPVTPDDAVPPGHPARPSDPVTPDDAVPPGDPAPPGGRGRPRDPAGPTSLGRAGGHLLRATAPARR